MARIQKTITFSPAAQGGTFKLSMDGARQTQDIYYNLPADDFVVDNTVSGFFKEALAGNLAVTGSTQNTLSVAYDDTVGTNLGIDASNLYCLGAGQIQVERIRAGADPVTGVQEVQTIDRNGFSGAWSVNGNALTESASAAEVEEGIEMNGGPQVAVTLNGAVYTVTFDDDGPQDQLDCQENAIVQRMTSGVADDPGQTEIQQITIPANANGGTWSLNASDLDYLASALDVESVLDEASVSYSPTNRSYYITWIEPGSREFIMPDGMNLRYAVSATIT